MEPVPETTAKGSIKRFAILAIVLVALASGAGWLIGKSRTGRKEADKPGIQLTSEETKVRGQMIYTLYCANCHGLDGHGDGPSAALLTPRPRDFAARPWHFPMTADSIRMVTLEGIPGTGMTAFRTTLSTEDMNAVVEHVLELATHAPTVEKPGSVEETVLKEAGFVSLHRSNPPTLVLNDSANRTIRISDYSGQLVLLHFWGTSCTHCVKEIPAMNELERRYQGRLKVLHICTNEEDPVSAQKVLDQQAPGTIALTESQGIGLSAYEVQSLPTVWLIAPDGKAIARSTGAKDWASEVQVKLLKHWLPEKKPDVPQLTPGK